MVLQNSFNLFSDPAKASSDNFLSSLSLPRWGGMLPPTQTAQPLSTYRPQLSVLQRKTTQPTVQPKSTEFDQNDVEKFKDLVGKGIEPQRAKRLVLEAKQPEHPSFIEWVAEKTGESFAGGLERIKSAGEWFKTWEYSFPEAAVRGAAGSLQSAFSPVAGVLGQSIQSGVQELPEGFRQWVSETVSPAIQSAKEWYNSQTPEQKRNLENIGVSAEVLANFIGVKAAQKWAEWVAQATKPVLTQAGKIGTQAAKTSGKVLKPVVQAPVDMWKTIVNTVKKYIWTPDEIAGIQSAIKPRQRVKNGVNLRPQDTINSEISLANGLIRESGVKPTDLATYKTAIKGEMEKIGQEINRLTGQDLTVDLSPTASKIRQIANSREVQLLDPSESGKLLRMADDIEKNGVLTLSDAEAMNQFINDTLKSTTTSASEAYKRGLQVLVGDIRDNLDTAISNIPGQFKDIKKAYGALRNVYGDAVAREIVYNRQNVGGLIDSIGAIEWAGNVISGGMKILTGQFGAGFSDIGKGITQNAVGRFIKSKNDPNNIIRSIFEKSGSKKALPSIPKKPANANIP